MLIAMYFSGRIRTSEESINKLLEFKKNNNVVFFCSLNCSELSEYDKDILEKFNIKEKQLYFEKVIFPEWVYNFDSWGIAVNRESVYSQAYNNKICFNLIEQYEKYNNMSFDCVIKYRTDILSENVFTIEELEENTIYVPHNYDWSGLNDQIAFGKPNVMKIYSTLFDRIHFFCDNGYSGYHAETLNIVNIHSHNINIKRVNFIYTLNPIRRQL